MRQLIIKRDASNTLKKVIEEVGSNGHAVREIWKNDLRSEFDKDQAVNGKFVYQYIYVCLCVHGVEGGCSVCIDYVMCYVLH